MNCVVPSLYSCDRRECYLGRNRDVALWINNDEGFYSLAREVGNYEDFVDALEACSFNSLKTPDGVSFKDPKVNILEINSDVFDF